MAQLTKNKRGSKTDQWILLCLSLKKAEFSISFFLFPFHEIIRHTTGVTVVTRIVINTKCNKSPLLHFSILHLR